MSEAKKISIGAFVAAKLDAGKRRVAKTRKRGSYGAIYPETAKAVLAEPRIASCRKVNGI